MMFPTYGSPEYAAIERQAHELRRQVLAEIGKDLRAGVIAKFSALQSLIVSMRQQRGRNEGFFEAQ
jgi:hypothetical protein